MKAPKNQYNNFGKYHYRSCEDILEAVKPLLGECVLTLSDTVKECGGMVFIEHQKLVIYLCVCELQDKNVNQQPILSANL